MRMHTTAASRTTMTDFWRRAGLAAACALWIPAFIGATRPAPSAPAQTMQAASADSGSPLARGEYLATRVAMCVQCHSGRDRNGDILESEKFRGAPLPVRSPYPNKEWAGRAPALAGLPGFTDAQIVALLTEGRATDRTAPRAPMPPFRMSRQDAEAIVAYLRSR
jgi:mono/diheme cytochrome c family protein